MKYKNKFDKSGRKYYNHHIGACANPNYKILCCKTCIGYKNKFDISCNTYS